MIKKTKWVVFHTTKVFETFNWLYVIIFWEKSNTYNITIEQIGLEENKFFLDCKQLYNLFKNMIPEENV